jgi:hypothetical protein
MSDMTDIERTTVHISHEILATTNDIENLGKYQMDLLSKVYIRTYASENIIEAKDEMISSSAVYDNFLKWLKEYNTNEHIVKYFSCPIFVKYFSDLYDNKRLSGGKNWINIQFKDSENDIETVSFCTGTMMTLVAYGLQDAPFDCDIIKMLLQGNRKIGYTVNEFKPMSEHDNNVYLNYNGRACDLFKPIKLIISGDLSELNKLTTFKIRLNKDTVYTLYYFDLLLHTNIIKKTSDEIVLNIEELPYFQPNSSIQTMIIGCKEKTNLTIKMISEGVFLDCAPRRKLFSESSRYNQLIRLFCVHVPIHSTLKTKKLKFEFGNEKSGGLSKGLFIKCNTHSLKNITIMLNGHKLLNYDKTVIDHLMTKIDDELIYIHFDRSYHWSDYNKESYRTGVNFARIDLTNITLEFDDNQADATIYTDGFNCLECVKEHTPKEKMQISIGDGVSMSASDASAMWKYDVVWIDGDKKKNDTAEQMYISNTKFESGIKFNKEIVIKKHINNKKYKTTC